MPQPPAPRGSLIGCRKGDPMNTMHMTRRSLVIGLAACALLAYSRPVASAGSSQDRRQQGSDLRLLHRLGRAPARRRASPVEVIETPRDQRGEDALRRAPTTSPPATPPRSAATCMEGHVPAAEVKRLLAERPTGQGPRRRPACRWARPAWRWTAWRRRPTRSSCSGRRAGRPSPATRAPACSEPLETTDALSLAVLAAFAGMSAAVAQQPASIPPRSALCGSEEACR